LILTARQDQRGYHPFHVLNQLDREDHQLGNPLRWALIRDP
jgi:DNA-directed RNA polymerase subunit L